jgi:transposase
MTKASAGAPAKQRKRQRAGGKQGKPFVLEQKEVHAKVFSGCKNLIASNSKVYVGKKLLRTTAELFEFLTGSAASPARAAAKNLSANQLIIPPKKKGPAPAAVDEKFEGFYDWVVAKIEEAKKGGWITLGSLKRDLALERAVTVSKRVLRRTLRKLGFRYVKRVGQWISRRNEERIQRRLWDFLEWAVANSSRAEVAAADGGRGKPKAYRYVWDIPTAFQDETAINDGEFRKFSICAPVKKGGTKLDRAYDRLGKGDGPRVNVLHCIFSHIPQPARADGAPECLEAWKSTWIGKKHKYVGRTVEAKHIEQYFLEHVFHRMAGGAVCLDNASTHTAYTEEMRDMEEGELDELIATKTQNQKKGSYRGDFVSKEYVKLKTEHLFPTASQLRGFIRKHHLMDTKLYADAVLYNVARLIYLPQYHPECNPIERYWALLKRYYYDSSPTLPHKSRMAQALARIPEGYVDKCFHKSLAWIWAKHAEMKISRVSVGEQEAVVADEDMMSDSESESEGDD